MKQSRAKRNRGASALEEAQPPDQNRQDMSSAETRTREIEETRQRGSLNRRERSGKNPKEATLSTAGQDDLAGRSTKPARKDKTSNANQQGDTIWKAEVEGEAEESTEHEATAAADIESIFAEAKSKKGRIEKQKGEHNNLALAERPAAKCQKQGKGLKNEEARKASGLGNSKPRKRTAEGYAVYSEQEILWNKGGSGGTKLCPFDCDCCF